MAKTIGSLVLKIFSIFIFAAAAGGTLFFAYGYRFDVEERVLQKTSIIDVNNKVQNVTVVLDGEKITDSLPFQIKNVLPGIHELKINKEDFRPWERVVSVKEDIVTIIYDVLLVPEVLDDYIKDVREFSENEHVFFDDDYILVFENGENKLSMLTLSGKGVAKEEIISLYQEDFEIIEVFPDERFIIRFNDPLRLTDDSVYAYISFSSKEFKLFVLPDDVRRLRVDGPKDNIFYMRGDSLFSVRLNDLPEDFFEEDNDYLLLKDVQQYDIDAFGRVYYISKGMLFRAGYDGTNIELLDHGPVSNKNLSINPGGSYAVMVLRNDDDERRLFIIEGNGVLTNVTGSFKGGAFRNSKDELIYCSESGHIFTYSIPDHEKRYVVQLIGEFDLLGWFFDDEHFLYLNNGDLYLSDLYNANPYLLFEEFNAQETVVDEKAFYYKDGDILKSLYFGE